MVGLGFFFRAMFSNDPAPSCAEENLAWSLGGLHAVGLLILFLFLPISGFFPGELTVLAAWVGSPGDFWISLSCVCS